MADAEFSCDICGATTKTNGEPFTSYQAVNWHKTGKHGSKAEQLAAVRDLGKERAKRTAAATKPTEDPEAQEAKAAGRKPPKPSKPADRARAALAGATRRTAEGRRDLTPGIQANLAFAGILLGTRNEWRGRITVEMAPTLAQAHNEAAQAGPDWLYKAYEMIAAGGPIMNALILTGVWVAAMFGDSNPRLAAMYEASHSAFGLPDPPWQSGHGPAPKPQPSGMPIVDVDTIRRAFDAMPPEARQQAEEMARQQFGDIFGNGAKEPAGVGADES